MPARVTGTPDNVTERHLDAVVNLRRQHEQRKGLLGRAADFLVARLGTLACVGLHLAALAVWLFVNNGRVGALSPFDPYPYPLLSTVTSVEAILLALFVLITQNRQARLAERRADMDLHVSLLAEHEATRLIALAEKIAERVGVDTRSIEGGDEIDALKEVLQPHEVMQELEQVEEQL